jgi:hypothetical protein
VNLEQNSKTRLTAAAEALIEAARLEADAAVKSELNTLTRHAADVKSELTALKSLMAEEYRQTHLQRALTLTDSGAFRYVDMCAHPDNRGRDSSKLAADIIKSFLRGYGYNLPAGARIRGKPGEDYGKMFRDKITRQIKDLTQREPRVVQDSNGWIIYYS